MESYTKSANFSWSTEIYIFQTSHTIFKFPEFLESCHLYEIFMHVLKLRMRVQAQYVPLYLLFMLNTFLMSNNLPFDEYSSPMQLQIFAASPKSFRCLTRFF